MMNQQLPKSWMRTTVGNISENVQYGYTASSENFDSGVRFLRITDIQDNKVDWENVPFCQITDSQLEKFQLFTGDILFARTGATVGKSFLIREIKRKAVFASYLIRLTGVKNVDVRFIKYFFESQEYWEQISNSAAGIGQPNVNATKLKEIGIPLPPHTEQQRIVTKLDSLFARIDKLKSGLERFPKLLKDFRQSVLTQAVTGKLTEEWREGRELEEWKVELSSDCCKKVQNGGTPKADGFCDDGIPFLKVYNIVNNRINFDYRPQYVTDEAQYRKIKKSITFPGDIIMNIVGPPLNKIAIIPNDFSEWNLNQAITLFRPKEYLNHKFLYYFFCEGKSVRDVMGDTRGVVGQVNISLTQCRNFEIPIPPITEQQEIVLRVDSLFAKADILEAQYQTLRVKLEQLPQAILAKAFRGELVKQLPTDGDARDLLEQIKQAKAELAKTGKTKTKRCKSKKLKADEELDIAAEPKGRYRQINNY
jgi:type I restriction enzyme S subunit